MLKDSIAKKIKAQDFIDDIILIATGKSIKNNTQKLVKVHNQICKDWKAKHWLKFSFPKYYLIYINRKQDINYTVSVIPRLYDLPNMGPYVIWPHLHNPADLYLIVTHSSNNLPINSNLSLYQFAYIDYVGSIIFIFFIEMFESKKFYIHYAEPVGWINNLGLQKLSTDHCLLNQKLQNKRKNLLLCN